MRIAVCEAADELTPGSDAWKYLTAGTSEIAPDCLLLPDLPFSRWFPADEQADPQVLSYAIEQHQMAIERIHEFGAKSVVFSRPLQDEGANVVEAVVWQPDIHITSLGRQTLLADAPGNHKARHFQTTVSEFTSLEVSGLRIAAAVDADIMRDELLRQAVAEEVAVILVPRSNYIEERHVWLPLLQSAALRTGAFVASSNRSGPGVNGRRFAGESCICNPHGHTSDKTGGEHTIAVHEIDIDFVSKAKEEFPAKLFASKSA